MIHTHIQIVECPEPTVPDTLPLWFASKWLAMNTLMLDPKRVLVESEEKSIHKMYESLGIECVKVSNNDRHAIEGSYSCY